MLVHYIDLGVSVVCNLCFLESEVILIFLKHMDDEAQAQRAIRELDGYELHGLRLRVQESTSRVRQQAGMGNPDMCYRCGSGGHWSKECPRDGRMGGSRYPDRERGGRNYGSRYDPYPPPPPPSYARERMMRYRVSSVGFRLITSSRFFYR